MFGTSPLSSGTNGFKSYTIWYKAVSDGIVDLSDILFHFKCFLIFNVVTNNPSQIWNLKHWAITTKLVFFFQTINTDSICHAWQEQGIYIRRCCNVTAYAGPCNIVLFHVFSGLLSGHVIKFKSCMSWSLYMWIHHL